MDYGKTLENAQEQLKGLMAKREAIDREILALSKIIEGAQIGAQQPSEWNPDDPNFKAVPLAEQEPTKFADKVRMILEKSGTPLMPTEIRDRLESMGVEATSPKHLLIHVHKVLERLWENDEVAQEAKGEKVAYRFISAFERVLAAQLSPLARLGTPNKSVDIAGQNPNPALAGLSKSHVGQTDKPKNLLSKHFEDDATTKRK